jgi:hypothetical protein
MSTTYQRIFAPGVNLDQQLTGAQTSSGTVATNAPTVQYLRLDSYGDPIFDPNANLTDAGAVMQIIQTRLNLFLSEWWEDLTLGLPVFQAMLGQLGSARNLDTARLAVQQNIAGSLYVSSVSNVAVAFTSGALSITATAQTIFGTIAVSASTYLGAQASL